MRTLVCALLVALCVISNSCAASPTTRGLVYVSWNTGGYSTPDSDLSLKLLAQTGSNTVSIVVTWYQPSINSVKIAPLNGSTPNDADVSHAIKTIHSLGMKVCLKPHVDLSQDNSHWRGQIGTNFNSESQWDSWFASYTNDFMMPHVVKLAIDNKVEMINIGTELSGVQTQEQRWRTLVGLIRNEYHGVLVYGSNWDSYNTVAWFDAIDFIGVDAYFPLSNHPSPTLDELHAAWQPILAGIQKVSQKFNKKVMFMEIGYTSTSNTAMMPAGGSGNLSLAAQTTAYQAFFDVVYTQPWFDGVQWWAWSSNSKEGGRCDDGFTVHDKPTEALLQKYYTIDQQPDHFAIRTAPSPLQIYANGVFGPSWDNWSYGGTFVPQATDQVYPGDKYSLSAAFSGWGAISLHTSNLNVTAAGYTALQFVAYGSPSTSNHIAVAFVSASGANLQATSIANYLPSCLLTPKWVKVTIPLADMDVGNGMIQRVNINNAQADPFKLWVDQIVLL